MAGQPAVVVVNTVGGVYQQYRTIFTGRAQFWRSVWRRLCDFWFCLVIWLALSDSAVTTVEARFSDGVGFSGVGICRSAVGQYGKLGPSERFSLWYGASDAGKTPPSLSDK